MTARRLVQAGHSVAVLEARDRVGGRTWSQRRVLRDRRPMDLLRPGCAQRSAGRARQRNFSPVPRGQLRLHRPRR
ncbi:FAD-dependent oxidoreductase [Mycobacteroides abscessus]|uniref:FAD-dependent oxidoreductase n=1 Tax=Mycobacteroides abscessus TaxID=36809 RepID=UPI003133AF58